MKKDVVALGGIVAAIALYAHSRKSDDDLGGVPDFGGFWGGGASTVTTTTTEETPSEPSIPDITIPAMPPYVAPTPTFTPPALPDYTVPTPVAPSPAPKKTSTPAPSVQAAPAPVGGDAGFGGGGSGGRSGDTTAPSGGISFHPLSALLGAVLGGPMGLFTAIAGPTLVSSAFGGVTTPAAPTVTPTATPTSAQAPASSKKSVVITGETSTDSAGNFTGAITYPDYSRSVTGADGARYVPYTITDHTGVTRNQVIRTGTGGKKHAMSVDSARILSSDRPEAVAWRKRYGGASTKKSSSSSSSSKKSSSSSSSSKKSVSKKTYNKKLGYSVH